MKQKLIRGIVTGPGCPGRPDEEKEKEGISYAAFKKNGRPGCTFDGWRRRDRQGVARAFADEGAKMILTDIFPGGMERTKAELERFRTEVFTCVRTVPRRTR